MRPSGFFDWRRLTLANWITVIRRDGLGFIGVILAVFTVVFLMWASNKGFDITDEGFYLLSSQFPSEVNIFVNTAHIYTSMLYRMTGGNVVALRLAGLCLTLLSAGVFLLGFQRLADRFKLAWGETILFKFELISLICLGAMLYYEWFLATPSYNSHNAFALTTCSGLIFFALAGLETLNRKCFTVRLALFAAGLCIGISFFVKFSTGISLFTLFGLVLAVWPRQALKIRMRALGFVILGVSVWLLFHFVVIQSPATWWKGFRNGLEVNATYGYNASALGRYLRECRRLAKIAIRDFWMLHVALVLGFTILTLFRKAWRDRTWLPSILILSIFAIAVWQSYRRGFYLGGMGHYFLITRFYLSWLLLLITAVVAVLIYCQRLMYWLRHHDLLPVLSFGGILFLLPLVGAVGTGNYIFVSTLWYMASWFGLLLILLTALALLLRNRLALGVGALIIGSFACVQIVSGCLYGPYRLNTGLLGQTQATGIGYPTTILKLDPETGEFFNRLRHMAEENGFKPGDDVLGFFDLPGVVFALGATSPANPWYNCGYKGSRNFAEKALSSVPPERLRRAFILETSGSAECMPDLAKFGIKFPGDYILCGELAIPYPWTKETVRFWKPRFS